MQQVKTSVFLVRDLEAIFGALDGAMRRAPGVNEDYRMGFRDAILAVAGAVHADEGAVEEMLSGVYVGSGDRR